jgi:phage terminase large subunit-like protein
MGRHRLSIEEKKRRGTYRPALERYYAISDSLAGTGATGELVPEPLRLPDPVAMRDFGTILDAYVAGVQAGTVVACQWVRLACGRQVRDLARQVEPGWPYVWSQAEADKACHFIECCPHVEGRWASECIRLEPWQVFVVSLLFGWRRKGQREYRRFTALYLEVARKSAKSTLAAAIAYYHLLREGELGASVICGATTGQQARMVFDIMQRMGRKSNWLRWLGVEARSNTIACPEGMVRPVNSRASSLDGLNPSCIILDESHAQDFGLHDVLKSAQGARPNPLMLCPTTAGYDLLSVGYAMRTQVCKVLQGVYEADHLLGVVYALDEEDEWTDEAVWAKANPMIGISPKWEYMRKYCADARQAPGMEGEFKVKACSLWARSAFAWLSMLAWDRCAVPGLTPEDYLGQPCWVGGDLANVDDLASVCLVFKRALPQGGYDLVAFWRSYLPADVIEDRARLTPAYREWLRSGELVATEGTMTDVERIEADVVADCARFDVRAIVFDQWGSTQTVARLKALGLPAVVEPKNAKTTTGPARELEARVKHGRFAHDGGGLAKWAASNVNVTRRVDDSLIPKKESAESPNKIDPIDALISAMGAALRDDAAGPDYQVLVIGGRR